MYLSMLEKYIRSNSVQNMYKKKKTSVCFETVELAYYRGSSNNQMFNSIRVLNVVLDQELLPQKR